METALLALLYLTPIFLVFGILVLIAEWLEGRGK
jgi:hypothetical protein